MQPKTTTMTPATKQKATKKKATKSISKHKRTPHAYALFVKAQYPAMKQRFKHPPDRIREIARLWRESKHPPQSQPQTQPQPQMQPQQTNEKAGTD